MDGQQFDDLTRALAAGIASRRGFVRGLAGLMLGGSLGLGGARSAAACGPEQVLGAGRRCVCRTTGRPPDPATGFCPCPTGRTRCGGVCVDLSRDLQHCGGCSQSCQPVDACEVTNCNGGVCERRPVVCQPPDQCHEAGICDRQTGQCHYPSKVDGTPCDDGDPCTYNDVCIAGVCAGTPAPCAPLNDCQLSSICDGQGGCTVTSKENGSSCRPDTAGQALCLSNPHCVDGVCTGNPVLCVVLGEFEPCKEGAHCNENNECVKTNKPDGTFCDDPHLCGAGQATCQAGVCVSPTYIDCAGTSGCRQLGCDGQGGCIETGAVPDYTPCESDPCLVQEYCLQGVCQGGQANFCVREECKDYVGCANGGCYLTGNTPAGQPSHVPPGDCEESRICDGNGGVVVTYKPVGTDCRPYGDASCFEYTCSWTGNCEADPLPILGEGDLCEVETIFQYPVNGCCGEGLECRCTRGLCGHGYWTCQS